MSVAGLIEGARRIVAPPDGPLVVATTLAMLAMIEVVAAGDPSAQVSTRLLLCLCATTPLVLVPGQALVAAGGGDGGQRDQPGG